MSYRRWIRNNGNNDIKNLIKLTWENNFKLLYKNKRELKLVIIFKICKKETKRNRIGWLYNKWINRWWKIKIIKIIFIIEKQRW